MKAKQIKKSAKSSRVNGFNYHDEWYLKNVNTKLSLAGKPTLSLDRLNDVLSAHVQAWGDQSANRREGKPLNAPRPEKSRKQKDNGKAKATKNTKASKPAKVQAKATPKANARKSWHRGR